ncbi:Txe/YoeB family addiction module toxin [Mucilaginibacter oryzae]|uniref:Txe/YoeB family addiction module toxin n=1 Tax=Mucilaginibacter oryzae TaxID=468058 RepID=UPI002482F9A6|nr:Txe/YoeB family addiction module toxin [Mucilaginibacter oryzae]
MNDLDHWKKIGDTQKLKKIRALIEAIIQSPFTGIGKPEALKYNYSGMWSRRIDHEHRIIYRVNELTVEIISLRTHYQ